MPADSPPHRSLAWTVERQADPLTVALAGDLDENAGLYDLQPTLTGRVVLDLGGVRRINSAGVREWVNFIRDVEQTTTHLALARCSPAIVMQMNMIANFRGSAEVLSFYAPLVCPACEREEDGLVEATPEVLVGLPHRLPTFACPECRTPLELDDIPERYFAFLKR